MISSLAGADIRPAPTQNHYLENYIIEDFSRKIASIALSRHKGTRKEVVEEARLIEEHGIEGDAHAGDWRRQVIMTDMLPHSLSTFPCPHSSPQKLYYSHYFYTSHFFQIWSAFA